MGSAPPTKIIIKFNVDEFGDYILIDTSHPEFREYTYDDDEYTEILFDSSYFDVDEGAGAGIFLSPDKIDDVVNIIYNPYSMSEDNFEYGIDPDHCTHILTIHTSNAAFDASNGLEKEWYFYYFLRNKDGAIAYYEIEGIFIDRKVPDVAVTGGFTRFSHSRPTVYTPLSMWMITVKQAMQRHI